jgi:hypothetical protein
MHQLFYLLSVGNFALNASCVGGHVLTELNARLLDGSAHSRLRTLVLNFTILLTLWLFTLRFKFRLSTVL